jgi:hypothetical protein
MRRIFVFAAVVVLVLMMIGLLPLNIAAFTQKSVIDFEEFKAISLGGSGGYQPIQDYYSRRYGVSFTGATSLSMADDSLSPYYPPKSGDAVVFDYPGNGTITIIFSPPVIEVGGYFTSMQALTFTAYDSLDNQVGQDLSLDQANYIGSETGVPPNFYLHFAYENGISKVIITDSGNTYTLDDLTFMRNIYGNNVGGEVSAIDKTDLINPWLSLACAAFVGVFVLILNRWKISRIHK